MRKLLWGCTVLMAIAAGGVYFAANHLCPNPDCWVRSCFPECGTTDPGTRTGPVEHVPIDSNGCSADGLAYAAGEYPPGAAADLVVPLPVDVELPPARLPGQIVIADADVDDANWPRDQAMPPIHDVIGALALARSLGQGIAEEICMPRIEEDVAEAERAIARPEGKGLHRGAVPFLGKAASLVRPPQQRKRNRHAGTEESEPHGLARIWKDLNGGVDRGSASSVDTMEFRPSDAPFPTDLRGPF